MGTGNPRGCKATRTVGAIAGTVQWIKTVQQADTPSGAEPRPLPRGPPFDALTCQPTEPVRSWHTINSRAGTQPWLAAPPPESDRQIPSNSVSLRTAADLLL